MGKKHTKKPEMASQLEQENPESASDAAPTHDGTSFARRHWWKRFSSLATFRHKQSQGSGAPMEKIPCERWPSIDQYTNNELNAINNIGGASQDHSRIAPPPILKLPGELLLMIFQWHPRRKLDNNREDPMFIKYRQTIASTCSAWREIALSTSNWWNVILYDGSPRSTERCNLCLERAGSLNLYLNVEQGNEWDDDVANGWMKSHAESLARCTHLSLQLMRSPGFSLPIPIPGLRNYESATDDLGDSRVPESHYSLHRVVLSDAVALDFPWVSLNNALTLTHLVIHLKRADTPAGLTPFLSECRALKYLSLVLHGFHGFHAESEVSLPSLESLHLEGYVSERFCAALKAPQLKQLRMDTEMPSGDLSPTLISFPFLEHLEAPLTPFTENDTLLDLIPRLSILRLIRITELDLHHFLSVLDALTEHATSWTLNQSKDQSWLNLRSLEISLQLHSEVWAGLRSGLLLAIKSMHSILGMATAGESLQTRVAVRIRHPGNLWMTPSNEGLPHNDVLVYGPLPEREVWNVWAE